MGRMRFRDPELSLVSWPLHFSLKHPLLVPSSNTRGMGTLWLGMLTHVENITRKRQGCPCSTCIACLISPTNDWFGRAISPEKEHLPASGSAFHCQLNIQFPKKINSLRACILLNTPLCRNRFALKPKISNSTQPGTSTRLAYRVKRGPYTISTHGRVEYGAERAARVTKKKPSG
jgi:hypothetical protein